MPTTVPAAAPRGLLRRLLVPSLLDVFFGALLLAAFAHPHGLQIAALRWRHRLAHPHRRIDFEDGTRAGGGSVLLQPPAASRGWPGSGSPTWCSRETWRWRGLAGVAALAGAVLALAATALLARILRRGCGLWIGLARDHGGGERVEHSLPGAAARLFDPVLHAGAVDSGRGPRCAAGRWCGCWCR